MNDQQALPGPSVMEPAAHLLPRGLLPPVSDPHCLSDRDTMASATGAKGEVVVVAVVGKALVEPLQFQERRAEASEVSCHQDGE